MSLINHFTFRYRALSLPSSSRPSCCGRSRCSCPSSSTTQPSSSPTGPGTHQPSTASRLPPLKWKCLPSNGLFMCSCLSSSQLSAFLFSFFFSSQLLFFLSFNLFTLSLLLAVTLPALLFWAGCHSDLHVRIMICTVVAVRRGAAHGD